MTAANHNGVVRSLAFDEARAFGEQAETEFDRVLQYHDDEQPNSAACRLAAYRAAHCRKMAEIHAILAVAEALAGAESPIDSALTFLEASEGGSSTESARERGRQIARNLSTYRRLGGKR